MAKSIRQPAKANRQRTQAALPRKSEEQQRPPHHPEDNSHEQRPPFLKSGDIGRTADLELLRGTVRSLRGKYGDQIVVDVRHNGDVYSWGINTSSPNIRLLIASIIDQCPDGLAIQVRKMESNQGRPFIGIESTEQPRNEEDIPF